MEVRMSRKDDILNLRAVLIKRRDALRRALTGGIECLNAIKGQMPPGDMADNAMEAEQGDVNSQLAEVESRELERTEEA